MTVQVLHQQGMSARGISRELNLARQTVLDVLAGKSDGKYGPRLQRATKLAPYHDFLAERVKSALPKRISATVLLRELRERGYDGGISQLKIFLASLRPPAPEEIVQRFETDPGQQMQIDFVIFRRGENPLKAFTASLGYSRMSFVHFSDNERAETWIDGLERAFSAFGGVPKAILCDNAKAVVLERHAYGEGKHRFHALLNDVMKHYGVRVYLCHPYRAQTKGKVERFHRYLRDSFFVPIQSKMGTHLIDVNTANREVGVWLNEVANVRIHATLKERPCDRFILEREALRPLPLPFQGFHPNRVGQENEHFRLEVPFPMESLQHPLQTYDIFSREVCS